jgi:hypothetical protein
VSGSDAIKDENGPFDLACRPNITVEHKIKLHGFVHGIPIVGVDDFVLADEFP